MAEFGPLTPEELTAKQEADTAEGRIYRNMIAILKRHTDRIRNNSPHPNIVRRNTGYALDRLTEMEPFTPGGRPFNLAELLCGSEGTLAITAEAEVRLTPLPTERILVIPHFASLNKALEAAVTAVAEGAVAVELMDDIVLSAALENEEQKRNRFFLEGAPAALLLIELHADTCGNLEERAHHMQRLLQESHDAYAAPILARREDMTRAWALRKAGLGLLMGVWSDTKTPEFMEDTAVRVTDLPAYIRDIQALMARYKVRCVYYGHASVGELHLRPELNVSTRDGRETMQRMAEEVADLVRTYRGSLSGEHGDGRVRAPYIERVLGAEMTALLDEVKQAWDPDRVLNPGKIVRAETIDAHLRLTDAKSSPDTVKTVFQWRDQHGFEQALGRCNGAGVCRKLAESGGVMCPSYMATREEKDSTRGRANLFRQLYHGKQRDAFASEDLKTALNLCLSCKACKTECPANVDMARMKAEFMHGWRLRKGGTPGQRFFAAPERALKFGARMPAVSNYLARLRPVRALLHSRYGIHRQRSLPPLAALPFYDWFRRRPTSEASGPAVLILNDVFMNYLEPDIGKAMVRVLEIMGCHVAVTPPMPSVRARISQGYLDEAKMIAEQSVRELTRDTNNEVALIGQEPSELLTFRDEVVDLVDKNDLEAARNVAARAFLLEEYVNLRASDCGGYFNGKGETVQVHGHCHAKSLTGMAPLLDALRVAGYVPVDMQTGCCGLAGSFGYESAHYPLSMQIGELKLFPSVRALPEATKICAHGFSCRHQILDGTGRRAGHPAQLLAAAI